MAAARPQRVEVGVRDLRNNLSRHLVSVKEGAEIVVTDHGRPVARLVPIDAPTDRLAELEAKGLVRRATDRTRARPPGPRITPKGSVSDLVADQRR